MFTLWHVLVQRLQKSPFVAMTAVLVLLFSVGLLVFGLPSQSSDMTVAQSALVSGQNFLAVGEIPDMDSPPPAEPPLSFIAFGDNGSGMLQQQRVAAQLIRSYEEKPYTLALMLGDNFYPDGNVKLYGEAYFNRPYAPLLKAGVRFRPVLGNHDTLRGFDDDQVRFFRMPAKYYDFVAGPVHFYALDTIRFDARQRAWLAKRLAGSRKPWNIVYGHYPIFSSGQHGSSQALMAELKPMLEKYHVDLYLAGHDHDYERFAPVNGVTYLVSGGGGASLRKFRPEPEAGSMVRMSVLHFLRFEVDEHQLTFQVIGTDGEILDEATLTHDVAVPSSAP